MPFITLSSICFFWESHHISIWLSLLLYTYHLYLWSDWLGLEIKIPQISNELFTRCNNSWVYIHNLWVSTYKIDSILERIHRSDILLDTSWESSFSSRVLLRIAILLTYRKRLEIGYLRLRGFRFGVVPVVKQTLRKTTSLYCWPLKHKSYTVFPIISA